MTRSLRSVPSRLAMGGLVAGSLLQMGCSAEWFTGALQGSNVRPILAAEGTLTWTCKRTSGLWTEKAFTVTDPTVKLPLEEGSQLTTFKTADIRFVTGEAVVSGAKNVSAALTASGDIPLVAVVPFTATVGGKAGDPGAVAVHVVTSEIISRTDPEFNVVPPTFFASAILRGTNLLGQAITGTIDLPVVTKVTVTDSVSTVGYRVGYGWQSLGRFGRP